MGLWMMQPASHGFVVAVASVTVTIMTALIAIVRDEARERR